MAQKIEGERKKNKEELNQKIEDFVNLILEMQAFMAMQGPGKNKVNGGGNGGGNSSASLGGKGNSRSNGEESETE